jgi:hypothetical protein
MEDEENKQKISELEDKVQELTEAIENATEGQELPENTDFIDVKINGKSQVVHFIKIEELTGTDYDECSKIKTAKDAQEAFRLAFKYREDKISEYPAAVRHGDYLVLECQGTEIINPESESREEVPDGCYYLGMCSIPDSGIKGIGCGTQEAEPDGFDCFASERDGAGDAIRSFTAWNTCGTKSECVEELDDNGDPIPKTIKIDEIVLPQSGASSENLNIVSNVTKNSTTGLADYIKTVTGVVKESPVEENIGNIVGLKFSDDPLDGGFQLDGDEHTGYMGIVTKFEIGKQKTETAISFGSYDANFTPIVFDKSTLVSKNIKAKEIEVSVNECGKAERSPEKGVHTSGDTESSYEVISKGSENGTVVLNSFGLNPSNLDLTNESVGEIEKVSVFENAGDAGDSFNNDDKIVFLPIEPDPGYTIKRQNDITLFDGYSGFRVAQAVDGDTKTVTIYAVPSEKSTVFQSGLLVDETVATNGTEITIGSFTITQSSGSGTGDGGGDVATNYAFEEPGEAYIKTAQDPLNFNTKGTGAYLTLESVGDAFSNEIAQGAWVPLLRDGLTPYSNTGATNQVEKLYYDITHEIVSDSSVSKLRITKKYRNYIYWGGLLSVVETTDGDGEDLIEVEEHTIPTSTSEPVAFDGWETIDVCDPSTDSGVRQIQVPYKNLV